MRRALFLSLVLAAVAAAPAEAMREGTLVTTFKHPTFGRVLARPDGQALYFWNVEKRAGFTIRCTGGCAKLWPPLIVRRGVTVAPHRAGFKGRFGVVRRPDGRRQLTYNRLPLYTYVHEGARQVLCNNVNGWFVVKT
jgi:predicted lipoprotein with Yx(FWY)xxD motif